MKKVVFLFGILFGCLSLRGQNIEIENLGDARPTLDSIFVNLEKNRVPTGLLLDFAVDLIDLTPYQGVLTDSTVVLRGTFEYILRSIRSSAIQNSFPFSPVSEIMAQMDTLASYSETVPIGLAAYRYNYITENAITDSLLVSRNGQLYDVFNHDNSWRNPYGERLVFAFSPYCNIHEGLTVSYSFSDFIFSNLTIQSLYFDAGDGNGYQHVLGPKTVSYSQADVYPLKMKAILTDGTVLETQSLMYVKNERSLVNRNYTLRPVDHSESFTYYSSNGEISSSISIRYASSRGTISNISFTTPLLIVEGFDPIDFLSKKGDNAIERYYNARGFTNLSSIWDSIPESITEQFDIIYVDWNNSEAAIQDNAELLIQIIDWINSHKEEQNSRIVVLAQSMGGLITRYALRKMELENHIHGVSQFISQDVPHLGATIPVGCLYALDDLTTRFRIGILDAGIIAWVIGEKKAYASVEKYFNSTSAKQMLINHINNGIINNSAHNQWQAEINLMGFPQGDPGYPIKNCAISNGGISGVSNTILTISAKLSLGLISDIFMTVGGFLTGDIISSILFALPGHSSIRSTISVNSYLPNQNNVFQSSIIHKKKVLWTIPMDNTLYAKSYSVPSGIIPYDNCNASYYYLDLTSSTSPSGSFLYDAVQLLLGYYDISSGGESLIPLVPTASSLCIGSGNRELTMYDYSRSYNNNISDTPFSAIYHPEGTWRYHMNTDSYSNWLVLNIMEGIIGPFFSATGDLFTVNTPSSGNNTTIQWESLNPDVATISSSGELTVINAGHTTVSATVTDMNSLSVFTKDILTGLPVFSLNAEAGLGRLFSISAVCADSTFYSFLQNNTQKCSFQWGVKRGNNEIVWDIPIETDSAPFPKVIAMGTDSNVYVYLKITCGNFNSPVYSIRCHSLAPYDPIILSGDGQLFASGEFLSTIDNRTSVGNTFVIDVHNCKPLILNHIPRTFELCQLLLKDDGFTDRITTLFNEKKEDSFILIPISIKMDGNIISSDVLKIVYLPHVL